MCPAAQRDTHRLPPGEHFPSQACLPSRVSTEQGLHEGSDFGAADKQSPFSERLLKQRAGHLPNANIAASSPRPVGGILERNAHGKNSRLRGTKGWARWKARAELVRVCLQGLGALSSPWLHDPLSCADGARRVQILSLLQGICAGTDARGAPRRGQDRLSQGAAPLPSLPCCELRAWCSPGEVGVGWGGRVSGATPPPSLAPWTLPTPGYHLAPGSMGQAAGLYQRGDPSRLSAVQSLFPPRGQGWPLS